MEFKTTYFGIFLLYNLIFQVAGLTWPITTYQFTNTIKNVGITLNRDSKIYIAGIDYFLEIDQDKNEGKKMNFLAESDTLSVCKSLNQEICFNSIQVLQAVSEDKLLICGSNSGNPGCFYYNITSSTRTNLNLNARNWLTSELNSVWPSVIANTDSDPQLYIASCRSSDRCATSRTINDPLRSESEFNNVKFLAGYPSTPNVQNVYFFFREDSSSFLGDKFLADSGQVSTNAMVSRVCKNDQGGSVQYSSTWMTLVKARLLCPYPNSANTVNTANTYFDIMVSTYRSGNTIYALFKYPSSWAISASAVCSYDLATIDEYFNGDIFADNITKYYDDKTPPQYTTTFTSAPPPDFLPGQCPSPGQTTSDVSGAYAKFVAKTPIIGEPITPNQNMPVHVAFDTVFDFVVSTKFAAYTLLYLLKDSGYMQKLRVDPDDLTSTVVLQETNIDLNGEGVLSFSINKEELVIVTSSKVLLLPVSDCSSNTNCSTCEADPHCDWVNWSCINSTTNDISIRKCEDPPLPPSGLSLVEESESYNAKWNGPGPMFRVELKQMRNDNIVLDNTIPITEIAIPKELILKGASYQLNIWALNNDTQSTATTTSITSALDMPMIQTIEFMREFTAVKWKLVEGGTKYDINLYRRDPYTSLQRITVTPFTTGQATMVNAFIGLEVGSEYTISVTAYSLDKNRSPESMVNFQGKVNERLVVENGTEIKAPIISPTPRSSQNVAGIIICVIIIIILAGVILQNHCLIGPRTKVLKIDTPNQFRLRRKFFFFFAKDVNPQRNQEYDSVTRDESKEPNEIA